MPTHPVTADPIWPFSIPSFGWPALLLTACLMILAAVWTYLRERNSSVKRVGVVLGIRLLALLLVLLALAGVSCVSRDELKVPSTVIVVVDATQSMEIVRDEATGLSRWDYMLQNLRDLRPVMEKLQRDHNINFVLYRFGDEVTEFDLDNPGLPDGKRTDTALPLRVLLDKYRGERYLRCVLLFSDGADNVASDPPARSLAASWRNLPCPLHTITYGSRATTSSQNDIVLTAVTPEPSTVAVKGKFVVRASIDATGFVGSQVLVKVFIDDELVNAKETRLSLRKDNLVEIPCDAPSKPGEVKLTVKVHRPDKPEALPGELSAANNEMSTYVTVSREGLSVLLIERQDRFPEPQMILSALAADKRIRVYRAWLRGKTLLTENQKDLFQFDQQPYDVIILGDVTAERLRAADPLALDKIAERVLKRRTGLLMMGGRFAFGNGDWAGTPIEKLLPVELDVKGQTENQGRERVFPTREGLRYIMRLGDSEKESIDKWEKLPTLPEVTALGKRKGGAEVFAMLGKDIVLMAGQDIGTGRSIAFAADTTHLWVRPSDNGAEIHSRFWRQVVLWLAHQEDNDDTLRVRLDTRRLRTGDNLGFGVELRGKQGETLKGLSYNVKIIDPKGVETQVETLPDQRGAVSESEYRGKFNPKLPGEYRVVASGSGTDPAGKKIDGRAEARFLAFQDDAETTVKAANPDFLKELAIAGGGEDHRPIEMKAFLEQLPKRPLPTPPPRPAKFPDWRSNKGPSPFLLAFLLIFVQLLGLEWFLRRRWGMV